MTKLRTLAEQQNDVEFLRGLGFGGADLGFDEQDMNQFHAIADDIEARVSAHTGRWNIDVDGSDLLICRGDHDKTEDCEWVRFMPKPESDLLAPAIDEKGRPLVEDLGNGQLRQLSKLETLLAVALDQANRGADKAGCDGWRAQEMCRQIALLLTEALGKPIQVLAAQKAGEGE